MDGKSADNSVEIIRKFESLLTQGTWPVRCQGIRYRWFSEKDNGQTDAINKGILMSSGDIIGWLNSDDTYRPNALQQICDAFNTYADIHVVYGKAHYIDEAGCIIGQYPTEPFSHKRLAQSNFICQPAAFFRKTIVDLVGYPNVDLHYAMDYDLWIRIATKCRFHFLPEILATYRLHAGSKTVSPDDALENNRECLSVALKHFHWAPANRVYSYYVHWYSKHVHFPVFKMKPIAILVILAISFVKYCMLNHGINCYDVKLLSFKNIHKLYDNRSTGIS
jgi:glycosyltransferase involved in cell wall biosynthesis